MLIPRISNFLWSKNLHGNKTSVYPKITIPYDEKIWKRWHDPDRLLNETSFESLLPPSDIYSLGLLFWEIAWFKPDNLPFKDIPIRELYNHLRNNQEKLPKIPKEHKLWERLIDKMWQFNPENRCDITTVETTISEFENLS